MLQDLRFALRLIAKEWWFSATAIVVLALGIGVNAMGFTLVSGVFLRGRALREANQIYVLSWLVTGGRKAALSHADFKDWRDQSRSFAHLAAVVTETMNLSDDHALPEQLYAARVAGDAFAVFGVQPILGRPFTAADERPDAPRVAIVAHHVWRNRFQQDPRVLGSTIRVNSVPAEIVGVMPEGTRFPGNAAIWMPFLPSVAQQQRANRPLLVFGRLRPGASQREANAESDGIAKRLIAAYPDDSKELTGGVVDTVTGRLIGAAPRLMFTALSVAVSFVLLIACANAANLLMARTASRAREIAMRMALGATRPRVVRQLLVETLLLGVAGGALGLALAWIGVRLFDAAVLDPTRPWWIVFEVDWRVFTYVAAVCVLTAVAAGLAPALRVSRGDSQAVLKEGGRGSLGGRRGRWFSAAMVVSQIALTIVLLAGAGLMVRSFRNLTAADNGYSSDDLLSMRVQLPSAKYPTPDARRAFYEQLEARIGAVAGMESVALTNAVPPLTNEGRRLEIDGRVSADEPPVVAAVRIGPRFLETLGRGLLRGRGFEPADSTPASAGVFVNERLARQLFPNEDPIGRRVRFAPIRRDPSAPPAPPAPWRTIVGVTPTIRHSDDQDTNPHPVVYLPFGLEPPPSAAWLLVRTPRPLASAADDIRRAVQAIDRDQPISTFQTVEDLLRERRWVYSAFGGAFAIFAAIALALASVGLYALMAYAVAQRTQEIGVRMALGASRWHVSWLFLKRGLTQVAIGLTLGLAGAVALSGALRSVLVGVAPGDPATLAAVAVLLIAVAVAACLVPARRATQVDPLVALRQE